MILGAAGDGPPTALFARPPPALVGPTPAKLTEPMLSIVSAHPGHDPRLTTLAASGRVDEPAHGALLPAARLRPVIITGSADTAEFRSPSGPVPRRKAISHTIGRAHRHAGPRGFNMPGECTPNAASCIGFSRRFNALEGITPRVRRPTYMRRNGKRRKYNDLRVLHRTRDFGGAYKFLRGDAHSSIAGDAFQSSPASLLGGWFVLDDTALHGPARPPAV